MDKQRTHRKTMEEYLGRQLVKGETVHHINGNHNDNRLENLQVVTPGEHNKIHHIGMHHSEETKNTLSVNHKGIPKPAEWRENISKALTGKEKSPEHRANLAVGHIGLKASQETRDKMSLVRTGKTQSAETKKKHSDARLGMKYDDEYRKHISEGAKQAWTRRKEREMENLRNTEGSNVILKS